MTGWRSILLRERRSLAILMGVALSCGVAVLALQLLADTLSAEVWQLDAAVREQRVQLNLKQDNLRNVRSHIARYERLRSQGLVGTPDRPLWVEELIASHGRLGLSTPLAYQLQVPRRLANANAPSTAPPSQEEAVEEPLVHDLQFEMRNVHEVDVLRLIQDFRVHVKGRFRVNACRFSEPRDSGMTAQCVLRFVTIPTAPASNPAN